MILLKLIKDDIIIYNNTINYYYKYGAITKWTERKKKSFKKLHIPLGHNPHIAAAQYQQQKQSYRFNVQLLVITTHECTNIMSCATDLQAVLCFSNGVIA